MWTWLSWACLSHDSSVRLAKRGTHVKLGKWKGNKDERKNEDPLQSDSDNARELHLVSPSWYWRSTAPCLACLPWLLALLIHINQGIPPEAGLQTQRGNNNFPRASSRASPSAIHLCHLNVLIFSDGSTSCNWSTSATAPENWKPMPENLNLLLPDFHLPRGMNAFADFWDVNAPKRHAADRK